MDTRIDVIDMNQGDTAIIDLSQSASPVSTESEHGRRENREQLEIVNFIDLKCNATNSKIYNAVVRDVSVSGLGCYFIGDSFPDIQTTFCVMDTYVYSLCWKQHLFNDFNQLGFKLVSGGDDLVSHLNMN